MRWQTLADSGFETFRKKIRKEPVLDDMAQPIAWQALCGAFEPFYPRPEVAGRRPVGMERMVPVRFLLRWFD